MSGERKYTQDEVNAIIRRALERSATEDVSHRELVETAKEVGIAPAELEAAIAEERREREIETERQLWLEKRRARLRGSTITWAFVNALCFAINFMTYHGSWWFLWVLVPWGLVLAMQFARAKQGPPREQLMKLRERRFKKMRREQLAARVAEGAQVIGGVVEQGVSVFLERLEENRRRLRDDDRDRRGGLPPNDPNRRSR